MTHDAPGSWVKSWSAGAPLAASVSARVMIRFEHEDAEILGCARSIASSFDHPVEGPISPPSSATRSLPVSGDGHEQTAGSLQAWLDEIAPAHDEGRRAGVRIAIDVDPSELI